MDTTIIQIPIEKKIRDRVEKEAKVQGFSSIQDMVRFIFQHVFDKKIAVGFVEPAVVLSKKNAARYDKMTKDFETGKHVQTASSVDEFMKQLGV